MAELQAPFHVPLNKANRDEKTRYPHRTLCPQSVAPHESEPRRSNRQSHDCRICLRILRGCDEWFREGGRTEGRHRRLHHRRVRRLQSSRFEACSRCCDRYPEAVSSLTGSPSLSVSLDFSSLLLTRAVGVGGC